MKLPIEWLKKYIDVSVSADKLSDLLTMSGSKVEGVEKTNGSDVIEIEVTTNRPDCLSILGLAHEISAITGKKVKYPTLGKTPAKSKEAIKIKIDDKKGCPKYTARFLSGVSIKDSPVECQKFLPLVDVRAINNTVDATNFVLFETGQPLHAFDADKLKGPEIIVRRAKKNEKFLAIDGNEYTLDEDTLVIADAERPVAIAGVMGGKLTEVTSETKNILLESAYFDPALVRRASKKYKLSTDSSYRFERSVTLENVEQASRRAADLILEWGGGSETGFSYKQTASSSKPKSVLVRIDSVEKVLGVKIPPSRIATILKNLGFGVTTQTNKISVNVPPFRRDVSQEADVIEEILRIEGFDKVPAAIPTTHHVPGSARDIKAERVLELKQYIAALGFQEIITYSLLSAKALRQSGYGEKDAHRLKNFVSAEQEYLRPSLLPGMLGAVQFNLNRKNESLKFFELGNRYVNGREETVLSLCLCGSFEENWRRKEESSFYDLKGVIENILATSQLKNFEWKQAKNSPLLDNASDIVVESRPEGSLGYVSKRILTGWDIAKNAVYAEINLENILGYNKSAEKVKPVAKFPIVRRDIAFIIDEKVPVSDIEKAIRENGRPYLKEVRLFDQYIGKNIASGKRSLAFSLAYQKDSGTFTEDEITALQQIVGETLKKDFQVEFR